MNSQLKPKTKCYGSSNILWDKSECKYLPNISEMARDSFHDIKYGCKQLGDKSRISQLKLQPS